MVRTNRELEGQIGLGQRATLFLQDPQFVQAVEDIKTLIFNDWVYSQAGESQKREQLWLRWQSMDELLRALRKPLSEATLAANEREANKYRQRMEQRQ